MYSVRVFSRVPQGVAEGLVEGVVVPQGMVDWDDVIVQRIRRVDTALGC